ncbi:MAG: type I 3-dehydroquinate dehydratase [Chlamydiia bacterium]
MIVYVLDSDENEIEGVDLVELRPDRTCQKTHSLPYLLTEQDPHAGASYVDIAYPKSILSFKKIYPHIKWIRSFHGPYQGVEQTEKLIYEMIEEGPDLVKICFDMISIGEFLSLVHLFERYRDKLILFGRGEAAEATRLLSYRLGAPWIYTSKNRFCGQIPLVDLLEVYQIHRLSRDTALYGLIKGEKSPPSIGYRLYNPIFAKQNIDALYMNLVLNENELEAVMHHPLFNGFSITMPFKEAAFHLALDLDPVARECGAINTYVKGKGYNTDIEILKQLHLSHKKVAILGGGGVAKAFSNYLKKQNRVTVFLRNLEKGVIFQDAVGVNVAQLTNSIQEVDVLIDTLPVTGTIEHLENVSTVIDMKVSPDPFYAQMGGYISGKEVFLKQGMKQLELFFGCRTFL